MDGITIMFLRPSFETVQFVKMLYTLTKHNIKLLHNE